MRKNNINEIYNKKVDKQTRTENARRGAMATNKIIKERKKIFEIYRECLTEKEIKENYLMLQKLAKER